MGHSSVQCDPSGIPLYLVTVYISHVAAGLTSQHVGQLLVPSGDDRGRWKGKRLMWRSKLLRPAM